MSNEVQLSKADIDTLNNMYLINQTLKINASKTEIRSVNESKTCACITNLENAFPKDFCIYDLREFLGALSIIKDPILNFDNDKYVIIKSQDGKSKLRYLGADEDLIDSKFEKDVKLPEGPGTKLEVISVTSEQLKSVKGAAAAMKLEYIGFRTDDDGVVFLSAYNKNNGSGDDTNGFSIEVGTSTESFELRYKTESLAVVNGDSTFSMSNKKISKVETEKEVFWISLDAESVFL
jgi:hypothetical protein